MAVERIAVLGAGLMGRGIAHAAAVGGFATSLVDVSPPALEKAIGQIGRDLDEGVVRGRLSAEAATAARARLSSGTDLEAAARTADFVIEAVPEDIDLKLATFARLDAACRPEVVLATNTSALSVTEIASAAQRPARVLGMHFFNPVPKMKLVDLVGLDIRLAVLEFLHKSLGERYRPAPLLVQHVKAGRLGRKVGRGVYDEAAT